MIALLENEVPISLCRTPDEDGKLVYDNPPGPEQYVSEINIIGYISYDAVDRQYKIIQDNQF